MADENNVADDPKPAEQTTFGKTVSAGKPQPAVIIPALGDEERVPAVQVQEAAKGAIITPPITNEDLLAYLETNGIKVDSLEKLKEKVNYVAPVELTQEQKTQAALVKEKKAVDLFVKGGGTVDQYVAIKKVGEYGDEELTQLSVKELTKELKESGFTDSQAEDIIRERYFLITDEELEQEEDETDKEVLKRKKEYGAKKLANRSLHTKTQAQQILADLTKAADSEDSDTEEEKALSSKIEEQFQKLPRKLTLEIGQVNNTAIDPIEYEVEESDLNEVKAMLQNPAERNNFLYNKDGSLNLTNLATVLTRNKMLESAVKKAYHEGGSRQVTEFRKTFPAQTAAQIGVGGSSEAKKTGQKGKLVGWSKPVVSGNLQHTR